MIRDGGARVTSQYGGEEMTMARIMEGFNGSSVEATAQ